MSIPVVSGESVADTVAISGLYRKVVTMKKKSKAGRTRSKYWTVGDRQYAVVTVTEPRPNKLFGEFIHAITRLLTYQKPVACAHCGKKRKRHWTLLVFFRVMDMPETAFELVPSENEYPPLTPVCDDHILHPQEQEE